MNIFNKIKQDLLNSLTNLDKNLDFKNVTIEVPKDKSHGDISTNAAMILCKQLKINPKELANTFSEELKKIDYVEKVEIAGPGFINIFLNNNIWYQVLESILKEKEKYGEEDLGKGEKVNVEYVSVNPTGPLHVGHTRAAIFADALAYLLKKVGYDVTKEYYINDAGNQIKILVKSAYLRYLEALGETIEIPEGCYPGEYLKPVGQKLKEKYGDDLKNKTEEELFILIRQFVVDEMMDLIREDTEAIGIEYDLYFSEKKELHDKGIVERGMKILEDKGLVYKGKLPPPRGVDAKDYIAKELTLFRSTQFGDDEDRAIRRNDGSSTYITGDIAYSLSKYERGYKKAIVAWGADHIGYVKRFTAITRAVSDNQCEPHVFLVPMVKFLKKGELVKLSKRAGNLLRAKDVVEEVGKDVLRFIMLTRQNSAPLNFDLEKVKEQTKDNPVFYVQYAHARACSVFRKLKELKLDLPENSDFTKLNTAEEIDLIKKLAEYPKIIESAAIHYEPHRITFYLQELASEFHSLWNSNVKFIDEENLELTKTRTDLVQAIIVVIKNGLGILGVRALEEMR